MEILYFELLDLQEAFRPSQEGLRSCWTLWGILAASCCFLGVPEAAGSRKEAFGGGF